MGCAIYEGVGVSGYIVEEEENSKFVLVCGLIIFLYFLLVWRSKEWVQIDAKKETEVSYAECSSLISTTTSWYETWSKGCEPRREPDPELADDGGGG